LRLIWFLKNLRSFDVKKVIVLFVVLFLFAACEKSGEEIANVNGKKITKADFENDVANLPPQYKAMASSPDVKKAIIENLVMTELLLQEAEKQGLFKDPDVKKSLEMQKNEIILNAEAEIQMLKNQKKNAEKTAKKEVAIRELIEGRDFLDVATKEEDLRGQYDSYAESSKARNPGAEIPEYSDVREDIRLATARQKWLEELREKAEITVNESFISEEGSDFEKQLQGIQIQ